MKQADVTAQFPDATKEQIKALLDIYSDDIENFKKAAEKAEGARDTLQAQIGTLNAEMQTLKAANAGAEDYKAKFEALSADITRQQEEATRAQADAELTQSIKECFAGKKFTSAYVENGLVADMKQAIDLPENKGKGYAELFAALTKDKEGIFAPENQPAPMTGFGTVDNQELDEKAVRAIMGLT